MDLHITARSVYTAFDLLGNVGGLIGVLVGVGAFIVGMLDYQTSENVLVQHLYKHSPHSQLSDANSQSALKQYIRDWFPACFLNCFCRCCKRPKKDELYEKGRDLLTEELDIVELLRKLRLHDLAIRKLIVPEQLSELISEAQQTALDEFDENNDESSRQQIFDEEHGAELQPVKKSMSGDEINHDQINATMLPGVRKGKHDDSDGELVEEKQHSKRKDRRDEARSKNRDGQGARSRQDRDERDHQGRKERDRDRQRSPDRERERSPDRDRERGRDDQKRKERDRGRNESKRDKDREKNGTKDNQSRSKKR